MCSSAFYDEKTCFILSHAAILKPFLTDESFWFPERNSVASLVSHSSSFECQIVRQFVSIRLKERLQIVLSKIQGEKSMCKHHSQGGIPFGWQPRSGLISKGYESIFFHWFQYTTHSLTHLLAKVGHFICIQVLQIPEIVYQWVFIIFAWFGHDCAANMHLI